eukprot:TRINITY_DN37303_c0_g1_i2.p1 TRINITY_DN37303_c0_g1~~TRINITY_DN37303_c0_g1_i2.p1  ORF type:complete len:721 (+),score=105.69 TRINITY_DN37303_c0_g1_i2:110-2272(+)
MLRRPGAILAALLILPAAQLAYAVRVGDRQAEVRAISVQVENDTPYDIDQLMLIHKYNGLEDNTHVLVWDGIPTRTLSTPQRVFSELKENVWNHMFNWRQDWWVLSWKFKAKEGQRCPCCKKEDGNCETWVTDPNNAFGQFWMDPLSYVKIAGAVVNTVVGAMSMGTSVVVSAAVTSMVADCVTDIATTDDNTDGFKACGIGFDDYLNSQRGLPMRFRIVADWKPDDRVVWKGSDEEQPEGVVGKVTNVKDEKPEDLNRVVTSFPLQTGGKYKTLRFTEGSLTYAFREGDIVAKVANAAAVGVVTAYSKKGYIGVKFETGYEWLLNHELSLHAHQLGTQEREPPSYRVEILEWETGAPAARVKKTRVNEKTNPEAVRSQCTTSAKAMPCGSGNADASLGKEVIISVINKSKKPIVKWAVIHKFRGLMPPLSIVDSNTRLEPGESSWRTPPHSDALKGKTLFAKDDDTLIFDSEASGSEIARLRKGMSLLARGEASRNGRGEMVVPVEPFGFVRLDQVTVLGKRDPSSVRTDTGFTFNNDYFALAWSFEEPSNMDCEVQTAMDVSVLNEILHNPEQKLLNIGAAVGNYALGVPVFWAGAIDVGKYQLEKYVRSDMDTSSETKPAYALFGAELLNLLAKGAAVHGFAKCNLTPKDVENSKAGKPLQIEIHDDKVVIKTNGGENECVVELAQKRCQSTEKCFATKFCQEVNANLEFSKPTGIV